MQKNVSGIKSTSFLFPLFLFIIAFWLRLKNLTFQSYWLDELVSVSISQPKNDFNKVYSETLKGGPPLYQILLWIWYKLIGYNAFSGRLLSVIFGAGAVVALYQLGKELFSTRVGIFAALLLAVNEFTIYYAQEVRAYSLLLMLSLVSSTFLFRFLKIPSRANFIFHLISLISLYYTHYYGFYVLITHIVFLLIFKQHFVRSNKPFFIFFIVAIFLSLVPLLFNILTLSKIQTFWIQVPKWNFWWYYFIFYFKSRILVVLFGLLLLFGVFSFFKSTRLEKENFLFLAILIFSTYSISYIRSLLFTPMLTERYTIIVVPAILLIIAFGLDRIKFGYLRNSIFVILILLSLYSIFDRSFYSLSKKENWKQVLIEVKKKNFLDYPIYDIVYAGTFYQTYADLLGIDLEVRNHLTFLDDMHEKKLPQKFWILDAHNNKIGELEIIKDSVYTIEETIDHYRANAVRVKLNNREDRTNMSF
jgi:uncharacterized membrane protein